MIQKNEHILDLYDSLVLILINKKNKCIFKMRFLVFSRQTISKIANVQSK